jgi:hypothetical protein
MHFLRTEPYLSLTRTEVIVYVVERSPNGTSKRIAASTLYSFVEQANVKAQLAQIGVLMSVTRTELSQTQLKQLLQNAPAGRSPESLSAWICFSLYVSLSFSIFLSHSVSLDACLSLSQFVFLILTVGPFTDAPYV